MLWYPMIPLQSNNFGKMSLFTTFVLLLLAASRASHASQGNLDSIITKNHPANSTKRIEEDEEEIGYMQSLLLNTPALATIKSQYQTIEVYESTYFGKVFVLDDCLQLTEKDAPHYNEMLAHVPLMEYLNQYRGVEKNSKLLLDILVLGGGDGYVVSEILKYPNIGAIDHVELDREVINVSKQFFPWAESVWDSNKVNLVIGDGAEFVRDQVRKKKKYHIIIQDASDPFWIRYDGSVVILPSHVLYNETHFQNMYELLRDNSGVLIYQAETYNIPSNLKEIAKWRHVLHDIGFQKIRYGTIAISTYPTGQIGFLVSHSGGNVEESICESDISSSSSEIDTTSWNTMVDGRLEWLNWTQLILDFKSLSGKTKYYHPRIHQSAFDLPKWVEDEIYGANFDILE